MGHTITSIERAFQLARSGQFIRVDELIAEFETNLSRDRQADGTPRPRSPASTRVVLHWYLSVPVIGREYLFKRVAQSDRADGERLELEAHSDVLTSLATEAKT